MRVDALNQYGLAGTLVDGEDGDGVFATSKDGLALEIRGAAGPVGLIHEPAVGMHVNGSGGLAGANMGAISQAVFGEQRRGAESPVVQFLIDLELVLALQRNKHPRPRGVKIKMPGLKIETASRSNRGPIGQQSILVTEYFQRARVFGFIASGPVAPRH